MPIRIENIINGVILARARAARQREAREEADRQWERRAEERRDRVGRLTFIFTIIATLVASAAFWEAHRQADEAHRQADIAQRALIETGRAWIKVIGSPTASIKWDKVNGGLQLNMAITVENKGSSPALNVYVFPTIIPLGEGGAFNLPLQTKQACHIDVPIGHVLFQGDQTTGPNGVSIDAGRVLLLRGRLSAANAMPVRLTDYILFAVIICADYKIPGDTATRTIGVRYGQASGSPPVLIGQDVLNLPLKEDILGNYAD